MGIIIMHIKAAVWLALLYLLGEDRRAAEVLASRPRWHRRPWRRFWRR